MECGAAIKQSIENDAAPTKIEYFIDVIARAFLQQTTIISILGTAVVCFDLTPIPQMNRIFRVPTT
jgi:hypothetical protein